jgi:uncharacterized protein
VHRVLHSWPVYLLLEVAGIILLAGSTAPLVVAFLPPGLLTLTVATAIAAGVAVLVVYLACRFLERRPVADAGLVRHHAVRGGGFGLLAGAGGFTLVVGALALGGWYQVADVEPLAGVLPRIAVVFVLLGAAALLEEVLFRSIVFRHLEHGLGTWMAIALSAMLFGALHLWNPNATLWSATAIALTAGLLLAALFVVTRSLWIITGVHLGWNFAQGPIFGAAVSGMAGLPSVLQPVIQGPELLTGGAFGPEASLITVVLWGSASMALLALAARQGKMRPPEWLRRRRYSH